MHKAMVSMSTDKEPPHSAMQAAIAQGLAALLTFVPLLMLNPLTFFGNTDALFYTIMLKLTAHHMALGEWFSQWFPQANGHIGSPAPLYYAPLANQLTAFLGAPLAPLDPFAWKRLLFGLFLAQWAGGMSAWVWLSRHARARNALIGSLLFTLFPYKWIYIYLHINLAQLWALALLPLLMMAAEDMAQARRGSVFSYGIILALLALIHPRTVIAFAAVPALYVMVFNHGGILRVLLRLAWAHLLFLLLAAFYLVPSMMHLDLIHASLANSGRMLYADNLSHRDIMLNFHYLIIAAMLIGLHARLPAEYRAAIRKPMLFWMVVLAVVAFLCTRLSQPIWDRLVILQFLQFPAARLHATALIAACALAVLLLEHCCHAEKLSPFYSVRALYTVVAVMTVLTLGYIHKIYAPADISRAYIEHMQGLNIILPPEYLTRWQPDDANRLEAVEDAAALPLVTLISGEGSVQAHWENSALVMRADIKSSEAILRLRQLYWPGWQAFGVQLLVDQSGFLKMHLPQGRQEVRLTMAPLPYDTMIKIISLLAWLGAAAGLALSHAPSRKAAPAD